MSPPRSLLHAESAFWLCSASLVSSLHLTLGTVCHSIKTSFSFISSTRAEIILPGVIRAQLRLCNRRLSSTSAPLLSGQPGEELQNPDLVLHSGLLPPLLPLSHLPLPALLPLQPLGQELLVPASLILPLILQLHKEAPRVRHHPLEAVRDVPDDGLQAAGVCVTAGGGWEGGGVGRTVEWRRSGSVTRGRSRWGCDSMWRGNAQAGFLSSFKTGQNQCRGEISEEEEGGVRLN